MRPGVAVKEVGASRRDVLRLLAAGGAAALVPTHASAQGVLTRKIPSSGEALPLVGLGSWITFNVGIQDWNRGEFYKLLFWKVLSLVGVLIGIRGGVWSWMCSR